jgi:excinuclease ABC subunit C
MSKGNHDEATPAPAAPPWSEFAPLLMGFEIGRVPTDAGCYIMRSDKGKVLYVGKAKNLRTRLRTYLNETDTRYTVQFLMRRVADIEFLVTANEKEALLLENSLIKQYKPRYNVHLKDDKTYVSLKLNVNHEYPRLTVTRKIRRDGAKYFGPYSSAHSVRETIRQFQRLFPLRLCSDSVLYNRTRPCLYHQMKRCCAPCMDTVTKEDYGEIVKQVAMAIEGRNDELEKILLGQIRDHADRLEFERAAVLRDRLRALHKTLERQRTVAVGRSDDRDVFGYHIHGRFMEVQVVFFRGGKMVGGRSFSVKGSEMPPEETFGSLLFQYYATAPFLPDEVLVPVNIDGDEVLSDLLSERRDKKVSVHWPQRGEKRALIDLAHRNAKQRFEDKRLADQANTDLLQQVQEKLGLTCLPQRVECFDIANLQGQQSVGSMVVFEGGLAAKNRYRRYRIKAVEGQDDFAMMREVLLRRYKRAIEEDDLPGLIVVDGGKGQLGVATAVLEDLGIEHLDVVGLAKARGEGEGARSKERFFVPGRKNAIMLPQHSPVVLLLAQVRDEAHRFANTYHRSRRRQSAFQTPLTEIPGVGAKRARTLLSAFGSVTRIGKAAEEDIAALPGISSELASTIKNCLQAKPSRDSAQKTE